MALNSPLNDEDRKTIDAALVQLAAAEEHVKRAKLAGIDVSAEEAQVKELTEKLRRIKGAYFPNVR